MSSDDQLNLILKELIQVAKKDGVITEEEQEIISQVEFDSDYYDLMLSDALEDGIITEKENQFLHDIANSMLERAEVIAGVDGKLSDDEKRLIQKLSDIIKHKHLTS